MYVCSHIQYFLSNVAMGVRNQVGVMLNLMPGAFVAVRQQYDGGSIEAARAHQLRIDRISPIIQQFSTTLSEFSHLSVFC